nr:hypothetical protein [Tanacetum cinerariifolium]
MDQEKIKSVLDWEVLKKERAGQQWRGDSFTFVRLCGNVSQCQQKGGGDERRYSESMLELDNAKMIIDAGSSDNIAAIMEAGSKDLPPMLAPAEAEAVQITLTGIGNDMYSTVDACPNACEMWKAIERLKQGESINVQDLETNLYWEFGKFTLRDGESLESYYSRFYKMMNELVRSQCDVTNHQVQNNDIYNVFAIESEHPEQSKSIHDTYQIEQDEHNVIIDSLDMRYDREQDDQDDANDLDNEHQLLASLIEKLKCEIDDSKNCNKFLET